jgi:hypothetical protein
MYTYTYTNIHVHVVQVPKEHNLVIDLPSQENVPVRLRVFIANSEDAKAMKEYICANCEFLCVCTYV